MGGGWLALRTANHHLPHRGDYLTHGFQPPLRRSPACPGPTLQPPLVSAKVPDACRQAQKHTWSLAAQGLMLMGGLQRAVRGGTRGTGA